MNMKKIKKEDMKLSVLLVIIVAYLLFLYIITSPENTIKNCLESQFNLTAQSIELESMGKGTYKLLNAPIDPVTGIKLEHWQIYTYGSTGVATFAYSLDLPQMTTLSITMKMSVEEENRLEELAMENGLSIDELVKKMLLQKLSH